MECHVGNDNCVPTSFFSIIVNNCSRLTSIIADDLFSKHVDIDIQIEIQMSMYLLIKNNSP